jgi:hypothetical protein
VAGKSVAVKPSLHRTRGGPFITDFTGFDRPWRQLAGYVPDLRVHELAFGAGYIALGHAHGR